MADPRAFEAQLLAFCRQHSFFAVGEGVVVAVSGGPDSLSLLYALARQRQELGVCLHAAHLNHGLMGEVGQEAARFVARTCQELEIPLSLGEEDVRDFRRRGRLSLEEAARQVRYSFLSQVAQKVGVEVVVVGHTATDQVETVLLHLVRGSGLRGLTGIAPLSPLPAKGASLKLARPLLWATREETEGYCQALRLSPRYDPSNVSLAHPRNFLRHQVIPLLRQLNPNLEGAILRLAASLREDQAFIEEAVGQRWPELAQGGEGIALGPLLRLPPALRRRLLLRAWEQAAGSREDLSEAHLRALEALAGGGGWGWLSLPRGLVATREGGRLWLGSSPPCPLPPLEAEHPLIVPGETLLPGWRVRAVIDCLQTPPATPSPSPGERELEAGAASPSPYPIQGEGESATPVEKKSPDTGVPFSPAGEWGGFSAWMDWERVGGPLHLRPRRPGDHFQPLGMEAEKKLQDFLVDARVPRPWRDRVPLLCAGERILWVAGYRIDERVKVTAHTRQVLRLELERW